MTQHITQPVRSKPGASLWSSATRGQSEIREWLVAAAACLAGVAAVAGLVVDDVYAGAESTAAMFRAWDLVTVVLVVPALLLSLLRAGQGSRAWPLLTVSLLAHLAYTYAYYVFGTGFNDLFLLHVVVFTVALAAFVVTLNGLDAAAVAETFSPQTHRRVIAVLLGVLVVGLGAMWVYYGLHNAVTGDVPPGSQLVETDTIVRLGIALDLALLVPLYAAAAVLLWRDAAWGYVLATVALVAGLLQQLNYVVALPMQVAADVPGAVATDAAEPVIVLVYLAGLLLLVDGARRSRREQAGHRRTPEAGL